MKIGTFQKEYAEKVYAIEQTREDSIIAQSGRMITVQGLSLTVISFLVSVYKDNGGTPIVNFGIVLVFILISLLFSLIVQFRFPKRSLTRIKNVEETINKYPDVSEIPEEKVEVIFYDRIKKIENNLRRLNNVRNIFLIISMFVFFCGMVLLFINVLRLI